MELMTAVSLRGDDVYRKAIKAVAAARGISAGDLVRIALDQTFGEELENAASFFTDNGTSKLHIERKSSEPTKG